MFHHPQYAIPASTTKDWSTSVPDIMVDMVDTPGPQHVIRGHELHQELPIVSYPEARVRVERGCLSLTWGWWPYWWVSDVKRVMWDFLEEILSCVSSAQSATSSACSARDVAAIWYFTNDTAACMSSAWNYTSSQEFGYVETKKLKRWVDVEEPCGTPARTPWQTDMARL